MEVQAEIEKAVSAVLDFSKSVNCKQKVIQQNAYVVCCVFWTRYSGSQGIKSTAWENTQSEFDDRKAATLKVTGHIGVGSLHEKMINYSTPALLQRAGYIKTDLKKSKPDIHIWVNSADCRLYFYIVLTLRPDWSWAPALIWNTLPLEKKLCRIQQLALQQNDFKYV